MTHLQALLRYQEVDAKLLKLDKALADSDEYKNYRKMQKFIKTAPEKLEALDLKATALTAEASQIAKQYEQMETTLAEFENIDELVENGGDISFYKKKMQEIIERLRKLKSDALSLEKSIKETSEEYTALKEKIMSAEKPYGIAMKKYKAFKESQDEERKQVETSLADLEKSIPENWLTKYKSKRDAKVFPIVFQTQNGVCLCGLDVPIAHKDKLKEGIECDSCHRIIFSE